MDLLDHIAAVERAFEIEPKPLDRLLEGYLRRHRELASAGRRLVAEGAFGVARFRRRLDGWLVLQGIPRPNARQRALLFLLWKRPGDSARLALDDLAREAGVQGETCAAMPKDFPGGVAAFSSFPDFLYRMLVDARGDEGAAALAEAMNAPATPTLRVNALHVTREELAEQLASQGIASSPTATSPYGLKLARRATIEGTAAFRRGMVELQDEASQLAVIAADPMPGETVLDACAGAGGKSLALAMLMKNEGRIIASDIDAEKLAKLKRRAERAGATIVEAVGAGALARRRELQGNFDLVLIDAPCSGSGTLRRSPDLKWRLSPDVIAARVATQQELLARYASRVRPGGKLAYVTCSLLPCENEQVAETFLRRGDFEAIDADRAFRRRGIPADHIIDGSWFRTDPREGDWDGFFVAIFRKIG